MATKPIKKRAPRPRGPIREAADVRMEFVATILLDGLVILTAIVVRWVLLRVLHDTTPAEDYSWAMKWFERISDIGLVAAAAIFTIFDLLKRVVIGARGFTGSVRRTPPE